MNSTRKPRALPSPAAIVPFLPAETLRRIAAHQGKRGQPRPEEFEGAFLLFDVSGFTALSERLTEVGAEGVEQLCRIVSQVFGPIADRCMDAGGDLIFMAGDGAGVLFRGEGTTLSECTRRAAHAALTSLSSVHASEPLPGITFQVRAALGSGLCRSVEVGGVNGHWLLMVDGPAVSAATSADGRGVSGCLMASAEALSHLSSAFACAPVERGAFRVERTIEPAPPVARRAVTLTDELVPVALTYLPPAVTSSLGPGEDAWLATFRTVTTLFIHIPEVEARQEELQRGLVICQEEMGRAGGIVHEVLGDKGIGFLCAFGLPGATHDDDAARAVDAAIGIRAALEKRGVRSGIGVATGPVHCGVVGSERRKQYEMYGRSVTLSARLMQAAAGDGILVDQRTRNTARQQVEFSDPVSLTLKGFQQAMNAYRPMGRRRRRQIDATAMVGRSEQLGEVMDRIRALRDTSECLFLQAGAGMGKSMLLESTLQAARAEGLPVLFGSADSMEQQTTLYAFRGILGDLFELYPGIAPTEARNIVLEHLERDVPSQSHLAPLLNVVLPLNFPETPLTQQLSGTVRAEHLRRLLLALFKERAEQGRLVIAIEDVHWLDPGSWSLLVPLLEQAPRVLLLATLRPMAEEPDEFLRLVARTEGAVRELTVLNRVETRVLLSRCLQVQNVSERVVDAVYQRSEGVPFHSEEIALTLRERGTLSFDGPSCELVASGASLELPASVTSVIRERIDRLSAEVQLSLKVASVLGPSFLLGMLSVVHPLEGEAFEAHARELVKSSFIVAEPERADAYHFRHALTHETAYGLLTPSQRRSLHQKVAQAIEHSGAEEGGDLSLHYARLADHWEQAENKERAAHYAALAAEQALTVYASQAAISFLNRALELDLALRGRLDIDRKRARWERLIGDACYSVPDNAQAKAHYEQVFRLCGFPVPRFSAWGTPFEVIKHVFGRYRGAAPAPSEELRARCAEALETLDNLTAIALWSGDVLGLAHLVFASDNIGRKGGPSSSSALARNMVGYSLVIAGLREIGERDMRLAHEMAYAFENVHARMVTDIFFGLTLTLLGRVAEAVPLLQAGWDLSRRTAAGLWRHRADFMLGEAHFVAGRYSEAAARFESCAEIAKAAEPQVQGFATAMRVLCELRLGGDPEALVAVLESEETGVPRVRGGEHFGLQLACAIGVQMELYLRLGRYREAHALALEEMDIVDSGDDTYSYFAGVQAHTQTALVLSALWERRLLGAISGDGLPDASELRRAAKRALSHLRKGFKRFPGAEAKYHLFRGLFARVDGQSASARIHFLRSVESARQAAFPWEEVVASVEVAGLCQGDDRAKWLERARDCGDRHGLGLSASGAPSLGLGLPELPA